MALTHNRLLNLERKLNNLLNPGNELKPIPTDFSEFVKNCQIRSGSEMKYFTPYKYQEILIKLRKNYNQAIICKSRQLGCTQILSADDLHQASLNQAFSSCYFMRNQKDVTSLSLRIKQMIHGLKEYIKLDNDTQSYIRIKDKGDIYLRNSSKEGTRSLDSLSRITMDEASFLENIQHIYESSAASSSLVEDCSKVLISTPSVKGGFYWDKLNSDNPEDIELVCEKVASGELYSDDLPGFYYFVDSRNCCKVIIHWRCHPIYNQINDSYPGGYLQYRQDKDGLSEEIVLREFDLKFIDSSKAYFSSFTVSECINGEDDYEDGLDVNADSYWMGVDPNFSASGEDYFCAAVLKLKDGIYTLVNLYRKRKMSSEYHLYQTSKLIEFYRPKRVIVENNSGGTIIVEQLQKQHGSIIVGQRTSAENKHVLVGRILLALEKHILFYPEKSLLIQELLNFRQVGNKLQASENQHDDAVMALAHCLSGCPLASDEYSPFASVNFDDLLV